LKELKPEVTCLRCLQQRPVTVYETRGGRVAGSLACPCGYRAQGREDTLGELLAFLEAPPPYREKFKYDVGVAVSWSMKRSGILHKHYGKIVAHVPPYHDAYRILGQRDLGSCRVERISRNPRYLVIVKRGRWGDARPRILSPPKSRIEQGRVRKKAS
jgi:hypothetical protein